MVRFDKRRSCCRRVPSALAVVFIACLGLSGCSDPAAGLVGTWIQVEGERPQTRLTLREDGTGKLDVPGDLNFQLQSWSVQSDRFLAFQVFSQQVQVRFELNDDALQISRAEGFENMNGTYRREDG